MKRLYLLVIIMLISIKGGIYAENTVKPLASVSAFSFSENFTEKDLYKSFDDYINKVPLLINKNHSKEGLTEKNNNFNASLFLNNNSIKDYHLKFLSITRWLENADYFKILDKFA